MSRLPAVRAEVMIRFLKSLGFTEVWVAGSHHILSHPDGTTVPVPVHKGEDMGRGLMHKILRDANAHRKTFLAWLKKKR